MFEDDSHFTFDIFDQRGLGEGLKKGNWKTEQIRGQIPLLVSDSRGLLT